MHWDETLHATYSIVARDSESGQLGVAVQTHQMCVGSAAPWAAAGAGALATQSLTNVRFGPLGLELLRQGIEAERVVQALVASDENAGQRQLAVVDSGGGAAAWTGDRCIPHASHRLGPGFSVQANMMSRSTVVEAMFSAFVSEKGDLAARMMACMEAAQAEDGDIRGMQSASLVIVPGEPPRYGDPAEWRPLYDLRVDDHSQPLAELARLVRLRRASLLDGEGHRAMEAGAHEQGLALFERARNMAPELEELGYWQALALMEAGVQLDEAVRLMRELMQASPRGHNWHELLGRIEEAGILSRPGAASELATALNRERT